MAQVTRVSQGAARPWFVAAAAGLILGGLLLLGRGASVSEDEREQAVGESWLREVTEQLAKEGCAFEVGAERARFAAHLRDSAPVWEAQARMDPSEALRRARVIQGWLACPAEGDPEGRQVLEETQRQLLLLVARSVRIQIALLRRAEAENQPAEAAAAVGALRELLDAHSGSLRERLAQLERRYKKGA